MKRPHRRFHLLIWSILAPVTALLAIYSWTLRPSAPAADLPPGVGVAADEPEGR